MITNHAQRQVTTNLNEVKSFGLQAGPKLFELITKNLYSDKPLAIIRELCANAQDAHKEAGITEPFLIIFPTPLTPTLRIRDYGNGLSNEEIETVYTILGGSTKDKTNDYHGGWGLGAKTPCYYTDTFFVTSHHENTSNTYIVFINDHGMPCYSLVESKPRTERTGLDIQIPIRNEDITDFHKAGACLSGFDPFPTIANADIAPTEYLIKTPHWGIKKDLKERSNYIIANIDGIEYKTNHWMSTGFSKQIVFFFKTGELDVTTNRESVDNTEKSRMALITAARKCANELENEVSKLYNSTDYASACRLRTTYELPQLIHSKENKIVVNHISISSTPSCRLFFKAYNAKIKNAVKINIKPINKDPIYWTSKFTNKQRRQIKEHVPANCYIIESSSTEEIEKILNPFNVALHKISDLPAPRTQPKRAANRTKTPPKSSYNFYMEEPDEHLVQVINHITKQSYKVLVTKAPLKSHVEFKKFAKEILTVHLKNNPKDRTIHSCITPIEAVRSILKDFRVPKYIKQILKTKKLITEQNSKITYACERVGIKANYKHHDLRNEWEKYKQHRNTIESLCDRYAIVQDEVSKNTLQFLLNQLIKEERAQ